MLQNQIESSRNLVTLLRQYYAVCDMRSQAAQRSNDRADFELYRDNMSDIKSHIAAITRGIDAAETKMATAGGNGAAIANDRMNIGEYLELQNQLAFAFEKLSAGDKAIVTLEALERLNKIGTLPTP